MQARFDLLRRACDIVGTPSCRNAIYTRFTMKARNFKYECPLTLNDALALLASDAIECQPIAGGQSLMPMMNLRLACPDVIVDINKLNELDFINEVNSQLDIGALVRYTSLLESDIVSQHIPLFSRALPHIAHKAIRNRGTIGGSVALADPAAEMPALLKALDATIVAVSSQGFRTLAADDFFTGLYETTLNSDELVHSIKVPVAGPSQRFGFYELARRHGDYAMVGVAIKADSLEPYEGLRIVFFGLSDHAVRAYDAENTLNGKTQKDSEALEQALNTLSTLNYQEDLHTSISTKAHLSRVVMKRALANMH